MSNGNLGLLGPLTHASSRSKRFDVLLMTLWRITTFPFSFNVIRCEPKFRINSKRRVIFLQTPLENPLLIVCSILRNSSSWLLSLFISSSLLVIDGSFEQLPLDGLSKEDTISFVGSILFSHWVPFWAVCGLALF